MAANCAGSYCFFCDDEYQGNKIFDPINTIVFEENEIFSEETTNILKEVENCLKESEEKRYGSLSCGHGAGIKGI